MIFSNTPNPWPEWLSQQQAAEYISVSEKTIYRLHKRGLLPRHTLFGTSAWRYKRCELDELFC
ncbi:helix-turn-helix transcriptional regulator [Pelagicoccus mobilis]|uniref:Helix-turn-helix domain-containing protein n=1 Tax=Pelagicoccus mobilis TaxID=415221 RepID=A0A934VTZ9_9BACT|nr:helix-turn-helix domain-containing protein [Pelagicoccus mobilis]